MFRRLIGFLIIILALAGGWYWMDYQAFILRPLPIASEQRIVRIEPGTGFSVITEQLLEQRLIANALYFRILARWLDLDRKVMAGEYALPEQLLPETLLRILSSGKVIEYTITLIEGQTFAQLMERIHHHPQLEHRLDGLTADAIMDQLGNPGLHPEGRFFPDTYRFTRGATDQDILNRAFALMTKHCATEWQHRAPHLPLKSEYEALILASIVERETAVTSERQRIAGVFTRRLRLGMRLQSDPTVIYGMGTKFQGNLTRKDLAENQPYNSYTREGLPPTPIAMPGLAAIHAVLHPQDDGALYFVAKGDGTHYFSTSLSEHNRAVRRYQLHEVEPVSQ